MTSLTTPVVILERLGTVWKIFLFLVPLVHSTAVICALPRVDRHGIVRQALRFPVEGGPRTFALQVLSWFLFAASILLGTGTFYSYTHGFLEGRGGMSKKDVFGEDSGSFDMEHAVSGGGMLVADDAIMASAVFSASMSLAFMVKSVLLFDPKASGQGLIRPLKPVSDQVGVEKVSAAGSNQQGGLDDVQTWNVSWLPSKLTASYIVVFIGILWSLIGVSLLLAQPVHGGLQTTLGTVCYVFAGMCFVIAAFTTHGLGGLLRYWKKENDVHEQKEHRIRRRGRKEIRFQSYDELQEKGEWRFFQPFQGGIIFVATQATGWVLFSVAILLLIWLIVLGVTKTVWIAADWAMKIQAWSLAAGMTAFVAEITLALSLLFFNARGLRKQDIFNFGERVASFFNHVACMCILYIPMHLTLAFIAATFLLLRPMTAIALWVGFLPFYYIATGVGEAEKTGSREWPGFIEWLGKQVQRVLPYWFGNFQVVLEKGAKFNPEGKYVFGYGPHGLYPLGAAYLPITPAFQKLIPVRPRTLSASIVFQIPLMRDPLLWLGLRVVTRETFVRTLRSVKSVLLVPGGQAELVETYRFPRYTIWSHHTSGKGECVFYSKHKGFVRLALEEQACLVPVIAFGEVTSLRNIIDTPQLHRWTYKMLGFPIPFLIGGRFGFLPFPSKHGLKFVIGKPLKPPKVQPGEKPTEQQVDEYHAMFYTKMKSLWNEHRKSFDGYESIPAVLV